MSATPPGSPPAPAPPAPVGQPAAPAPAAPAPAASPPAAAAPVPPSAAPPPKADPPAPGEPTWTSARTKSAEKAVLGRHGVESEDDLKVKLAKLKELEDGQKTEQQKLEAQAAEGTKIKEQLAGYATAQIATLTVEQQKAVKDVAGDDPGRQLGAIEALKPTWAAAPAAPATPAAGAQPAAPPGTPPAARPPVAPATTTHTQPAPDGSAAPAESHLARYEAIKIHNPVEAGVYRREHKAAIAQERKAKAAGG